MAEPQQRYRVIEKLESGGMAEVFRAESEGLQGFRKQVAIKRVLPHLSEKKKFISMFLDEARLSAMLSHSNCVQVFDIGVGDNAFFIVMEFVEGANLKNIVESIKKSGRQFPVSAAALICHEICKGLSYAHEIRDPTGALLNLVHRDMSPPNVLITKYGEVKIVDFGLAKASSQLEKSEPGIIKGKFSYLSPEAAMGQEVDARTDIFAVGIILWELLTQQRLFLGETDFQTVKRVQQAVVPPVAQFNRQVPPQMEQIVLKALARDPGARYQTAKELGQDLNKFMFGYGQAISTYDIAVLVQGAMRDRQRSRPQQPSIIDKLIEEALLEFTSLTEDGRAPSASSAAKASSKAGADPLLPDSFVDPTNWAKEIAITDMNRPPAKQDTLRASLPPEVFDVGNLSALEEGPVATEVDAQQNRLSPVPFSPRLAPGAGPPGGGPTSTGAQGAPSGRKSAPMAAIGVAVAVVAVAAATLAWVTHLIPHH